MEDNNTSDETVLDLIVLTIGVLVAIAVGLFVIASNVGSEKQEAMNREDPMFQAAVSERIAPFGRVVVDGETDPESAPPVDAPAEAKVVLTGPQVYNQACTACHSTGAGGAPKVGDLAAWTSRISAGMDTLNKHAIEGFQGAAGFMPARGGFMNLSDEEVINAVKYMVDESS